MVPYNLLDNERSVPVDDHALEAPYEWLGQRQSQRARPHLRDGHLADCIFADRYDGWTTRTQRGFRDAIIAAGLSGPDGRPSGVRQVKKYQMRHTWATELANAGMSIQVLMTLLGHLSPEMVYPIRPPRGTGPQERVLPGAAWKNVRRIPSPPPGGPRSPDRIELARPLRCSKPV